MINETRVSLMTIRRISTVLLIVFFTICMSSSALSRINRYKLNSPLIAGGFVYDFSISPDGRRVVYRDGQKVTSGLIESQPYELYSVPIGGGTVTKLNSPLIPGGAVYEFSISPDSSRVVYKDSQLTGGPEPFDPYELYSVPIGGGTVTKLNSPPIPGMQVKLFSISPDSSRVVYRADQQTDGVYELYSVPINGGTVTELNSPLLMGGM